MRILCYLFLSLFLAQSALADGIQITPVRLYFSDQDTINSFKVTNVSDKPLILEARAFSWSQIKGQNHYQATQALFIAPPIATVPPKQSQLFRVAVRDAPQTEVEQAFRIYVQEVIGEEQKNPGGLSFALRMGIPAFVRAKKEQKPALQWQVRQDKGGHYTVVLTNTGSSHVQVTDLKLLAKSLGETLFDNKTFAYVLPKQSFHWKIKAKKSKNTKYSDLHLQALTDSGKIDSKVNL